MSAADARLRRGLFAAFASLGTTAATIPAILPAAARALGTDLAAAVPALFGGLLVGVLVSAPLLVRFPARTTLILGSMLQAAALIVIPLAVSAPVFISATAVAGFGFGLVEAAGSVSAKAVSTGSATGTLNALLGTVAVCATLTPLVVAAAAGMLPLLVLLALIPLASAALLSRAPNAAAPTSTSQPRTRSSRKLLGLIPFAIALPLYVGVETVLSGFSATIPQQTLHLDPAVAALGTSAFWALMAVGRFTAAWLRRRDIRPTTMLGVGTSAAAALLGVTGLLMDTAPVLALLTLGLVVVLFAPNYGLIVGIALDHLDPRQSATITGVLVACGAAGGTFVPALVLLLSGGPAASQTFIFSALLCAAVPILVLLGTRVSRRSSSPT